ncbi:MobQ family relaxase, partial [Acinetobacter pittii]
MAIYHFSVKTISRGNGRSAVACAAYRSGEKLVCNFYGKEQDYTKKTGVEFTEIYAPENTNTELLNRQTLWNKVEKAERRKDALLAREFEIAFPGELNAEQRKNMLNELCQNLVKKYGVIVDAAIHAPHTDSGSDERNYHAHIMFTTRSINEHGDFSAKKYRDFSRDNGTETVSHWRESFAELCNHHLKQNGFDERVDHRSYEDQESDLEATQHEGPQATYLRRRGIFTEISLKNDEIKLRNLKIKKVIALDENIKVSEDLVQKVRSELQF